MFGLFGKVVEPLSKPAIVGIMMATSAIGTALSTHLWMRKVDRAKAVAKKEGVREGIELMADKMLLTPAENKVWLEGEIEIAEKRAKAEAGIVEYPTTKEDVS